MAILFGFELRRAILWTRRTPDLLTHFTQRTTFTLNVVRMELQDWADAELEGLYMDYDSVVLRIRESTGRSVELRCVGHVGLAVEGFWDEIVIEAADIVEAHPFLDRCLASVAERLGDEPPPAGSPARNGRPFSTLVVRFADGAQLLCTAARFEGHS